MTTSRQSSTRTLTSKNRLSHHTWKIPSPIKTPSWKILHHFTLAFVLSAVFLCVRSLTMMYDCSSLTWLRSSESCFTVATHRNQHCIPAFAFQIFSPTPQQGWGPRTFRFQRIWWYFRLRHVNNPMDIKRDFLCRRTPVIVAKAVKVFAVVLSVEGVVARRNTTLVDLIGTVRILDLYGSGEDTSAQSAEVFVH